jgi:hypothetical protein
VKRSVLCKTFYLSLSKSVNCCMPLHEEIVAPLVNIQGLGGVCTKFSGQRYGLSRNETTEITEEIKISCPNTDGPSPTCFTISSRYFIESLVSCVPMNIRTATNVLITFLTLKTTWQHRKLYQNSLNSTKLFHTSVQVRFKFRS